MDNIHIGQMIQKELKAQGRTVTWFAHVIHSDRSNVYKMFKRNTIDLYLLIKISEVLHYNFLKDCSDKLTFLQESDHKM